MGIIFKGWTQLATEAAQIAKEGAAFIGSNLYGSLNALYESLTDTPAPGSSTQTFSGHDHTGTGGGAVIGRGSVFCLDTGSNYSNLATKFWHIQKTAGWTVADGSMSGNRLGGDIHIYVTDGINQYTDNNSGNPCTLEAKVLLYARNYFSSGLRTADFKFGITNNITGDSCTDTTISFTTSTDSLAWYTITDIPVGNGGWQSFTLTSSCTLGGAGVGQLDLKVCALNIVESRAYSQPASVGANTFDSATARNRP